MRASALLIAAVLAGCTQAPALEKAEYDHAYRSISELQDALQAGRTTLDQLVEAVFVRVAAIDDSGPTLNAVLELQAAAETPPDGLLSGVPFMVKANIDVAGPMRTHAGSLALADHVAADDARLVADLKRAGALLVGTTNLSEWANFRSMRSVSGWSSIGGQTKNPHVLDRNPCGSSSGSAVAVAAGIVPFAIGTETNGSIICPAAVNGIVGVKPTLGMVSRDGIIPISATQDTAGPLTRSVRDAALVLQVIAQPDADDPASLGHPGPQDFVARLTPSALEGRRVGVWHGPQGADIDPRVAAIFADAAARAAASGAQLVDPVSIYVDPAVRRASLRVMLHDFHVGVDRYLDGMAVGSLAALIDFNELNAAAAMPWFGQDLLVQAETSLLHEDEYTAALANGRGAMRETLNAVFAEHRLDAIMMPVTGPAWPIDVIAGDRFSFGTAGLAAISGRPAVTLPAGAIHNLPIAVSLVGKPWRDADLLGLAYALERALPPPLIPGFLPTLER